MPIVQKEATIKAVGVKSVYFGAQAIRNLCHNQLNTVLLKADLHIPFYIILA